MKNVTRLLLAILLLFSVQSKSQSSLSLTTTSVSNSSPYLGDQISILTKLKNVSAIDTFNGPVDFLLTNIDSVIYNNSLIGKPAFAGTVLKLAPLEEKAALFTVDLMPIHFKVGPDIIIVWPVAAVQIIDSARAPLTIRTPVGIEESGVLRARIYTTESELVIENTSYGNRLEQVQIYNTEGACVYQRALHNSSETVVVKGWKQGVYVGVVWDAKGNQYHIRFVR